MNETEDERKRQHEPLVENRMLGARSSVPRDKKRGRRRGFRRGKK